MRIDLDTRSPLDLIMSGFGYFLLGIAALSLLAGGLYVAMSEHTDGRVVAYQVSSKGTGSSFQSTPPRAPVIEFVTSEGKTARITGTFYEREPSYAIDEAVPVRYRSSAPDAGVIDVFSEKWGFALAFAALGSLFLLAGRFVRGSLH